MFFKKKKKSEHAPLVDIPVPAEEIQFSDYAPQFESVANQVDYLVKYLSRNRIEAPRKGIFVNRELVHKLADYVHIIGQGDASIGAYVEEIILDHLQRNKETLDALFNIKTSRNR